MTLRDEIISKLREPKWNSSQDRGRETRLVALSAEQAERIINDLEYAGWAYAQLERIERVENTNEPVLLRRKGDKQP
jgi:hypothetical protein